MAAHRGRQPADVVALVQTATNLPIMLLALPAGAWADMFDRRTVMLAAQTGMLLLSIALAGLTLAGLTPPVAIIGITALLACGSRLLQSGAGGVDRRHRPARRACRGGGAQHPRVQRRAQLRPGDGRRDRRGGRGRRPPSSPTRSAMAR
ncbi:MAG: MFS transporter [Sphingomonas sp.]